jgi:UDP-N-acetylmuramoylalanine--D-glutamate ligase
MERLPDVTVIGITGTRGKSTVTQLIAHVLKENGMSVKLGGNIRGVANLPLLDEVEDGDYLVLELDSWQLQGFRDMNISPHISVFTSFMDDHMNYYKNDKEAYFNDKAAIYRNQEEHDVLIASPQAGDEITKRDKRQSMIVASRRVVPMKMIGEHNQMAAGLAYEAAVQCGLIDEEIDTAIATFKPVDGRLEDVGLYKGVRVFNDNNATTGDAVVAGIKAIEEAFGKKPIVITGGADKGLPKEEYERYLTDHTAEVVYLSGTGTDTLSLPKTYLFDRLEECVKQAFLLAKEGDIILFSPGFASFSKYFNNEYERNDLFVEELKKYI